jgi:hypothetical protein
MKKIFFLMLVLLNVNLTLVLAEEISVLQKIDNLSNSGFNCNKEVKSVKVRGYVCIGKASSYADTENIRIYIPEHLETTSLAKFHVFFHGQRREDTFLEDSTGKAYGDYGSRLKESNSKNSILIIPESSIGVSSYEQFSSNSEKLINLLKEIQNKSKIKMSAMTLSAHSGAYRVVNSLLSDENIRDQVSRVGLFDAIYAPLPHVETWLQQNTKNKLRLAWLSGEGATTEKWTNDFLSRMTQYSDQITNVEIIASPPTAIHMNIMQTGGLADFINGN